MSFEEQIQQWVSIDNQIKLYNEKLKDLRTHRNQTSNKIIEYVDTENLRNATVQISDGRLRFMDTKQQSPLTLYHVKKCLLECIQPQEKVEEIMTYIKNSREYKTVSNIKRSYTN